MTTERHDPTRADEVSDDSRSVDDAEAAQAAASSGPSTADPAHAGEARDSSHDDARSHDDDGKRPTPLFADADSSGYRSRWLEVQSQFVDDPRQAVERADTLVAELMQKLAETFAAERSELEQEWDRGGKVSTEDLRVALQRYRSFFDRLLSL